MMDSPIVMVTVPSLPLRGTTDTFKTERQLDFSTRGSNGILVFEISAVVFPVHYFNTSLMRFAKRSPASAMRWAASSCAAAL